MVLGGEGANPGKTNLREEDLVSQHPTQQQTTGLHRAVEEIQMTSDSRPE